MRGRIRNWYTTQPLWVRILNTLLPPLLAIALAVSLTKSGPEFRAIQWHYRHGNHITVSGVTFPVYYWYAPKYGDDWFDVLDEPGPLRPTNDTDTVVRINGRRDQVELSTPKEKAQRALLSFESGEFEKRSTFEWKVRSQNLECMQARAGAFLSFVTCYGDGPIYSVSFIGDDNALERLRQTIAQAK